jgi:hypothetical protein
MSQQQCHDFEWEPQCKQPSINGTINNLKNISAQLKKVQRFPLSLSTFRLSTTNDMFRALMIVHIKACSIITAFIWLTVYHLEHIKNDDEDL